MSYKNSKARFSDLKNNLFNVQVEDYGLSTREDIESKFNEFCQEKQNKYHISEIFPSSEKHKTLLLEQSYKQGSNENMLMNRTSSAAGIGKDNADSTKNLWTDSNESIINFAKEFGINTGILSQYKTKDEKIKYIVECLRDNLNSEFDDYLKKSVVRKQQIADFDKNFQKQQKKYEKEKVDVFHWIEVNSPFESLKKRLGGKIVETIIDYENLKKVEKGLEEIRLSFDATSKTNRTTSRVKIQLDNIPRVNNSELLMDFAGNSETSTKASARDLTRTFSKLNNSRNVQSARSTGKKMFLFNKETNDEDKEEEEKIETALIEKNAWNHEKEKIFFNYRYEAKKRLYNAIKSSDFSGVGFSPLVQSTQIDAKSKLQRDMKLAKYINGDPLTPQECKFLATTSRALNSHVDQDLIKTTLKHLDPSVIEAIEIDLAQNILLDYQKVRKQLTETRREYLATENLTKIENVSHADRTFKKHRKIKDAAQSQDLLKEKIDVYVKQIEDLKAAEKKEYLHPNQHHHKTFDAVKVRDNSAFIKSFTGIVHSSPRVGLDTKLMKHEHHPPSKLTVSPDHTRELLGLPNPMADQMIKKRPNENPQNLKLRIDEHPRIKNPDNFVRYFSGGPSEDLDESFTQALQNGKMDFGVTKIQENTLIRIQSLFRGLKERENFKLLRDQHIEELAIREKLEAMKDEPGFSLQEEKKKLKKKLRLKNDDYDEYEEKEKKRKARLFEALDIQYENLFGKKPYGYVEKKKTTMYSSRKPAETMILDQQTSFRDNQRSPTATIKKPGVEETIVSKKKSATPSKSTRKFMPKSLITIRPNTAIHGNLRRLQTEPNDIEDQNLERELEKKSEAVRKNQFGLLVKHQKLLNAAKKNERDIDILASYKFNENDANITDESGNTPLFYAARWGNKELCEYLLGLKARCNQRCQDGNTPLHMAFASNKVMIVILMIQHGGNLNILNDAKQTPIAFGSGSLLQSLDLTGAVATFEGAFDHQLPAYLDNNKFLAKSPRGQNFDRAEFKFNPVNRATLEVKSKDNQLHSYAI